MVDPRVRDIYRLVASRHWIRSLVGQALERGLSGRQVVRELAVRVRADVRAGRLAADEYWDCLAAADQGALDAVWDEVLKACRAAMELQAQVAAERRRADLRVLLAPLYPQPPRHSSGQPRNRRTTPRSSHTPESC